jgi:hypothetical protein
MKQLYNILPQPLKVGVCVINEPANKDASPNNQAMY